MSESKNDEAEKAKEDAAAPDSEQLSKRSKGASYLRSGLSAIGQFSAQSVKGVARGALEASSYAYSKAEEAVGERMVIHTTQLRTNGRAGRSRRSPETGSAGFALSPTQEAEEEAIADYIARQDEIDDEERREKSSAGAGVDEGQGPCKGGNEQGETEADTKSEEDSSCSSSSTSRSFRSSALSLFSLASLRSLASSSSDGASGAEKAPPGSSNSSLSSSSASSTAQTSAQSSTAPSATGHVRRGPFQWLPAYDRHLVQVCQPFFDPATQSFRDLPPPPAAVPAESCVECAAPLQGGMGGVLLGRGRVRYHCRHCGLSFCAEHCKVKTPLIKFGLHHPVRVCGPCWLALRVVWDGERVAWRLCRTRDYLDGRLLPYYPAEVDTGVDKALRAADGALVAAKVAPMGNTAGMAISSARMVRKYGKYGLAGFLLRHELVDAIEIIKELAANVEKVRIDDLIIGLYYLMAINRTRRGEAPDGEAIEHLGDACSSHLQEEAEGEAKGGADRETKKEEENEGEDDDNDKEKDEEKKKGVPRVQTRSAQAQTKSPPVLAQSPLLQSKSDRKEPTHPNETCPAGVYKGRTHPNEASLADVDELLRFAHLTLNAVYGEKAEDVQRLARLQDYKLVYHQPSIGVYRPAFALFCKQSEPRSSNTDVGGAFTAAASSEKNSDSRTEGTSREIGSDSHSRSSSSNCSSSTSSEKDRSNSGSSSSLCKHSEVVVQSAEEKQQQQHLQPSQPPSAQYGEGFQDGVEAEKVAVLVVRGSQSLHDVLTDARARIKKFRIGTAAAGSKPAGNATDGEQAPQAKSRSHDTDVSKEKGTKMDPDTNPIASTNANTNTITLKGQDGANRSTNDRQQHEKEEGTKARPRSKGKFETTLDSNGDGGEQCQDRGQGQGRVDETKSTKARNGHESGRQHTVEGQDRDEGGAEDLHQSLDEDMKKHKGDSTFSQLDPELLMELYGDYSVVEEIGDAEGEDTKYGTTFFAHDGMVHAAAWIAQQVKPSLEVLTQQGYKVVLAGHSLGGACAAILCALLRASLPSASLSCYTFGCPPCVDASFASAFCRQFVFSVVLHDDFVCRLKPESIEKIVKEVKEKNKRWKELAKEDYSSVVTRAKTLWAPKKREQHAWETETEGEAEAEGEGEEVTEKEREAEGEGGKEKEKSGEREEETEQERGKEREKQRERKEGAERAGEKQNLQGQRQENEVIVIEDDDDEEEHEQSIEGKERQKKREEEEEIEGEDKKENGEDAEASSPQGPPRPQLFIPGRIIHLFEVRGTIRGVFEEADSPCLSKIEMTQNMLQEHKAVSYCAALSTARTTLLASHYPPAWEEYTRRKICARCKNRFTWYSTSQSAAQESFNRKNCRSCGELVCGMCSEKSLPLPRFGIYFPARVCDKCYYDIAMGVNRMWEET